MVVFGYMTTNRLASTAFANIYRRLDPSPRMPAARSSDP